jgi:hypothetical protein
LLGAKQSLFRVNGRKDRDAMQSPALLSLEARVAQSFSPTDLEHYTAIASRET